MAVTQKYAAEAGTAVITANKKIADGIYELKLMGAPEGLPGQFVMLRVSRGSDPLLPRPISICDYDKATGELVLLYQVVGRGTALLANMRQDDIIAVTGPYGNGFTLDDGEAVLIGGGIGIAPLNYLARALRESNKDRKITTYLGFREEPFYEDNFKRYSTVNTVLGGFVTDSVDFNKSAVYYACGPEPMLLSAHKRAKEANAKLYVSLEKRMACGIGACYACSIKTVSGNRRVCKDGPVFLSAEVFYE